MSRKDCHDRAPSLLNLRLQFKSNNNVKNKIYIKENNIQAMMNNQNYWQNAPGTFVPPGYVATAPASTHPMLSWKVNPASTNLREERIKNVVNLLRASPMNMSVPQLLEEVIKKNSGFSIAKSKFMDNRWQINALLNAIWENSDGREHFEAWLREKDRALGLICKDIDEEMDAVKPDLRMRTKDLTAEALINFDFRKQVTGLLDEKAPTLRRILYRAAQDDRAEKRNTKKNPELVS